MRPNPPRLGSLYPAHSTQLAAAAPAIRALGQDDFNEVIIEWKQN